MRNALESRLRYMLVFGDFVWILVAFFLAYLVRMGTIHRTDFSFEDFMVVGAMTAALWTVILVLFRVFAFGRTTRSWFHLSRVVFANVVGVAIFVLMFYFLRHEFYSRWIIVYLLGFATVLILAWHFLIDWYKGSQARKKQGITPVLVVGSNRPAEHMIQHLQKTHSLYVPVAVLDAYGTSKKELAGVPVKGKLDRLEKVVADENIGMIIQADNLEHTLNLFAYAEKLNMRYILLPSLMGLYGEAQEVRLEDQAVIEGDKVSDLEELLFGR